jgi:lysozyme
VVVQPLLFTRPVKTALSLVFLVACADGVLDAGGDPTSEVDQQATVCGVGPTVKGIDVSYYEGTIDWNAVKADGVEFAFIRVSDGLGFEDPKFASFWAGSRSVGIVHGAYQFFRSNEDPIAQADLLLAKMGPLKPDDLPPVIDVETADGNTPAQVAAAVRKWVEHVTAAIGRPPIIYTGFYSWRDLVGGPDMTASPLWHAQYTSAACPNIAAPWTNWAVWQYTSTGTVAGISGAVDVDRWNGDRASLDAFLGPVGAGCGDGMCGGGEDKLNCPEDCGACATIGAAGAVIDDGDACFVAGGPQTYMRHVSDAGLDGDLQWTHTTANPGEANFGEWNLFFAEAGRYQVEVYTAASYAQSKRAVYEIQSATTTTPVTLDQTAVDGWQVLGEIDFAAGGHQLIHLADNTGEPVGDNVQLVFDGVRLTRVDDGMGSGSGSGSDGDHGKLHAGCSAGGGDAGATSMLAVVLLGVCRRRRPPR